MARGLEREERSSWVLPFLVLVLGEGGMFCFRMYPFLVFRC